MHEYVVGEKEAYDKIVKMASKYEVPTSDVIKINIGRNHFCFIEFNN